MKRLLFFLFAASVVSCSEPQGLTVMTLNMRYDNPEDGENNWRYRRDRVGEMIGERQVDLLGTQEVLFNQFEDLQRLLPGYEAVGVGREDGLRAGEFNAVFFRRDRFTLLDSGTFWLSETPETPGSKGWDGACERLATWVLLRDGDGPEFLFINTHLDHVGELARREGVSLLLERIDRLRGKRGVILTGDFNAEPASDVIGHVVAGGFLQNAHDVAAEKSGPAWSFSDFGKLPEARREMIDYIFIGGGFTARSYAVLPQEYDGGYLSDHAPVEAYLQFNR